MKHALVASDWWSSILVGSTISQPNFDDPRNVATIKRLASRYDVIIIVAPHWHSVGTQVRDRLRLAASELDRKLTLLRYAGSLSLRWGDQPGAMSVVPVSRAVTASGSVRLPTWTLRTSKRLPIRSIVMGGASHLLDVGNRDVIEAAKGHLVAVAEGWDGVFLDEVVPTYHTFQYAPGQVDPRYPVARDGSSAAYEQARRTFMRAITSHLSARGKAVGANIAPKTTSHGFFPTTLVRDAPGLTHPFIEVFGTDWEGRAVGSGSWDHPVTLSTMEWLPIAEGLGRTPIVNAFTADPGALRYALSLFLMSAGSGSAFSGNRPGRNDEYSTEPPWLPEYDAASTLGAVVQDVEDGGTRRRSFAGGCVVANVSSSATDVELGGAFRGPLESADTTRRTLPPVSGGVLVGSPFGTCPAETISTRGALKLVQGTWCAPDRSPREDVGARINLWAGNPGYRSDLRGWAATAGTLTRSTGGPDGLGVLNLSIGAGAVNARTWGSSPVSAAPGAPLQLSVWVRCNSPEQVILAVETHDRDGGYLAYDYGEVTVSTAWARVGRSVTLPDRTASITVMLQYMGAAVGARSIQLAGWLLEAGPPGAYFDGATPANDDVSYAWTGSPDASSSRATPSS